MNIRSAKFIKGVVGPDDILNDGKDQIAFIGRSNVGKSSTINALTRQKNLARTSSTPGHTQQVNVFLINNKFYLVDLPGYGFMKGSRKHEEEIGKLIGWYLFDSTYKQKKVFLIIDAKIGLMNSDLDMIVALENAEKNIVVVANKIDKIKKSEYFKQLKKIEGQSLGRKVIPYSAEKNTGIKELIKEMTE